ncbi:MAG: hypothetical protein ABEH88_07170 [Halobacteriales archaeon]
MLVDEPRRRTTLLVLSIGAVSHLLADALLLKATGRSYPILWPLTRWQPPTPGLYLIMSVVVSYRCSPPPGVAITGKQLQQTL